MDCVAASGLEGLRSQDNWLRRSLLIYIVTFNQPNDRSHEHVRIWLTLEVGSHEE